MKNFNDADFNGIQDLKIKYSMLRRIADGSFGMVYQMQNKVTRDLVAAKRLKHRRPEDVYFSRKEFHILEAVSGGPGVVKLLDYFESPAQSVIVTEYLEGGELFQKISSKDFLLSENVVRIIVKQLIVALQYLEEERIIHLDLKPNNIVFAHKDREDLEVKIIDFGLAKDLAEETDIPISTCGTPEFTSPEVIECGYASHRSDMWSLGVIVYMLASGGISPFFSRNSVQLEKNILSGEVNLDHPSLDLVSGDAKKFIRVLLVLDSRARWSARQCRAHKWLYAVDQTDAHLSQSSRLETRELRGFLARRRWVVWCGLVRGAIRISRSHGRHASEGSPATRSPSYLSSNGEIQLRHSSLMLEGLQGRWKIAYF